MTKEEIINRLYGSTIEQAFWEDQIMFTREAKKIAEKMYCITNKRGVTCNSEPRRKSFADGTEQILARMPLVV